MIPATKDDIILLTVDSWRADTVPDMENLSNITNGWAQTRMTTAAAATYGSFAGLMASNLQVDVYDDNNEVLPEVRILPDVLRDAGYETAAFGAANPYIEPFGGRFDTWWNGPDDISTVDKVRNLVTLRERVTSQELFEKAEDWWMSAPAPRFLWLHLMTPHEPYKPGIMRGLKNGPLRSYAGIIGMAKARDRICSSGFGQALCKNLYDSCIQKLDTALEWIDTVDDDATIVLTGDHGEEFNEEAGFIRHARLTEETIRVPFFTNSEDLVSEDEHLCQINVAPRLANLAGADVPSGWRRATETGTAIQPMLNYSPALGEGYIGARSAHQKIVKTYQPDHGVIGTNTYEIVDDGLTETPISKDEIASSLEERLQSVLSEPAVEQKIDARANNSRKDIDHSRLEELGYVE